MADIHRLTPGIEQRSWTSHELEQQKQLLRASVKHYLPQFAAAVKEHHQTKADMIVLHQDAFAAGYHMDEYTLLGLAIKYAGLYGIAVTITGKNGDTFNENPPPKPKN